MNRQRLIFVGGLCVGLLTAVPFFSNAVEIAPASAQDILAAMGPDAQGLTLKPESLPDLFALTAKHIEDNPDQIIVEQPYSSGRWKGGKAVIEYARDMSYTMVSVYDKEGVRQRIYSVRTKFTEHVAHLQKAPAPQSSPATIQPTPISATKEVQIASLPPSEVSPASHANNYEWDDAKGAYVPVAVVSGAVDADIKANVPLPAATPQPKAPSEQKVVTPTAIPVTPAISPSSGTGSPEKHKVLAPVPQKPKVSAPPVSKITVGNTTWTERNSDDEEAPEVVPPPKQVKKAKEVVPTPDEESVPESQAPAATEEEVVQNPVPKSSPVVAPSMPVVSPVVVPVTAPPPVVSQGSHPESPKPVVTPVPAISSAAITVVASTPIPVPPPVENKPPEKVVLHPAPEGDEWVPRLLNDIASVPKKSESSGSALSVVSPSSQASVPVEKSVPTTEQLLASGGSDDSKKEGVLPINSFEKFAGGKYGRHREYERRFYPGKKADAKVPDHDFYVDEVDRGAKVHNVYYYLHQIGRAPKLVAIERHKKVSFLKNYDIDKEDKGTISVYH